MNTKIVNYNAFKAKITDYLNPSSYVAKSDSTIEHFMSFLKRACEMNLTENRTTARNSLSKVDSYIDTKIEQIRAKRSEFPKLEQSELRALRVGSHINSSVSFNVVDFFYEKSAQHFFAENGSYHPNKMIFRQGLVADKIQILTQAYADCIGGAPKGSILEAMLDHGDGWIVAAYKAQKVACEKADAHYSRVMAISLAVTAAFIAIGLVIFNSYLLAGCSIISFIAFLHAVNERYLTLF